MRGRFVCVLLAVVCLPLFGTVSGVELSSVNISSESFSPARGQTVSIGYSLSAPADVTVRMYDPDRVLVTELLSDVSQEAGAHRVDWDGRDMDGAIVPDEAYFFTITAHDSDGSEAVYDPTTFSGGEEFDITQAQMNPESNTITYRLEEPSRILIRIGISGGPLLKSLVNWKPRISGEITEYWNGRDQDGLMNVRNHERFKMIITGFKLVENSVITYGNTETVYAEYKQNLSQERAEKPPRASKPRPDQRISPHYLRSRLMDRPISVFMGFPENESADKQSVNINSDRELVRVSLSEEDRARLIDEPFEVSFFLDGEYYSEEEVGYTPYNWIWDVSNIDAGEHILTVNLSSFKDIIGIRSSRVFIKR